MKNFILGLSIIALMFSLCACTNEKTIASGVVGNVGVNDVQTAVAQSTDAQSTSAFTNANGSKIAVIYSSFINEQYGVGVIEKGNTEIVADIIIDKLGADRYKIETLNDYYPKTYRALTDVAKTEQNQHTRPEIKEVSFNPANYDIIFVGAPVWWGDFPMIMYTFFDKTDLNGKTLIPFSTHAGSGISGFDRKLKNVYQNADVKEGLAIYGSDAQNNKSKVQNEVENWIKKLGY